MDCEPEELHFLGIAGIYLETSKLILSWRRLFTQIAATLMVPLSALFLAQTLISHTLLSQIQRTQDAIGPILLDTDSQYLLMIRFFSQWAFYLLFKSIYLLALFAFSLLSISAVAYTVASVYTAKHELFLSYRKVLSVVPKAWPRLALTLRYAFLIFLWFNTAAFLIFLLAIYLGFVVKFHYLAIFISLYCAPVYIVGLVWIIVVWHLASVVSVLEEECGKEAMKRSFELVTGKMRIAATVFVMMNLAFIAIEASFRRFVAEGHAPLLLKLGFSAAMLGLMTVAVLFAMVAQTVVYFVCRSYQYESIDKSAMADHLEGYLGEYIPIKANDMQMEQIRE